MASDINHVIVTGRLTSDCEAKSAGEASVFSGSVAVNRWSKKDKKDVASFFNFKVFSNSEKQTEFYGSCLKKGNPVVLDGTLVQETWEKDGQKCNRVVILANGITPIGKKPESSGEADNGGFPEDLPF